MRKVTVKIEGQTPYSQSKHYEVPRLANEDMAGYEVRTWRERLHVNAEGYVEIPPMAFKNCLSEAAKFLGAKIPGKRNETWTKHFEAGVLVMDPLVLGVRKDDVPGEWLFLPADGVRGSGKRVSKCMPVIQKWGGKVDFYVVDNEITEEAFRAHLEVAGSLIGIGRFRPRRNGYFGRFTISKLEWGDEK